MNCWNKFLLTWAFSVDYSFMYKTLELGQSFFYWIYNCGQVDHIIEVDYSFIYITQPFHNIERKRNVKGEQKKIFRISYIKTTKQVVKSFTSFNVDWNIRYGNTPTPNRHKVRCTVSETGEIIYNFVRGISQVKMREK